MKQTMSEKTKPNTKHQYQACQNISSVKKTNRMKKIYLNAIVILSVLSTSFLWSCSDDYFDTKIGERISPEQHYNSIEDAWGSFYGCFSFLQDITENMIIVDGLRSDQMDLTGNSDRDMIDIYYHELSAENPYVDPSEFYKIIINVNEVLPNLPQIVEKDRDFDEAMLKTFQGSLITLRAWAYLTLARLNGEVGLVEGNLTTIDHSSVPEYLTKAEIIDYLIDELLPFYDAEDVFRYEIDHYALLGELYLEKKDYANAIKYLKYACDGAYYTGGEYMISGTFSKEAWKELFLYSSYLEECIFTAVPYSIYNDQANKLEEWMSYSFGFMVQPTSIIVSGFENETQQNDKETDVFRGLGISYDTSATGIPFINKYSIDKSIPHNADAILYRAADVHLLLAEALNRNGRSEDALVLVNKGFKNVSGSARPDDFKKWNRNVGIRGRAYLNDINASGVEAVEDLILEERSKELAFEGKRWFDLVRVAERRGDPAYLADKVAAKYPDEATRNLIRAKLMDPNNWYLPLPKVE